MFRHVIVNSRVALILVKNIQPQLPLRSIEKNLHNRNDLNRATLF